LAIISLTPQPLNVTETAVPDRSEARGDAAKLMARLEAWLDASGDWDVMGADAHPARPPPWGSKERINRAGKAIREGTISSEDAGYVDAWRASHRHVLNTLQAILRNRTRGKDIVVAQRLKRRITIVDKLNREPRMQLARMDDVAGCRMIFADLPSLAEFRTEFHKARFQHRRRNELDKYDYIKRPKSLGYRGIHDVYEYNTKSIKGAPYKGLLLELQYRTRCQHAWATSVELLTHITGHEPKFNRGDIKYIEFFRLASEAIARTREDLKSCYSELSNTELANRLEDIEADIHVMVMLRRMRPSQETARDASVLILQIAEDGDLRIHEFSGQSDATAMYFKLEKEHPKDDIVLVNADTFESIRMAYRNYFSDVDEFVRFIDDGCRELKSSPDG
jgi:putative GTP pyrophosphokinase